MWNSKYIQDTIRGFLSPMVKIVLLKMPYKRPAVDMVDMDGDDLPELVGAYYCRLYPNQLGIDFSSVKSINSETKRDLKLEEAVKKEFGLNQEVGYIRYYYNKIDLNGDGIREVFVYLVGPFVCGTGGCSGIIINRKMVNTKYCQDFHL